MKYHRLMTEIWVKKRINFDFVQWQELINEAQSLSKQTPGLVWNRNCSLLWRISIHSIARTGAAKIGTSMKMAHFSIIWFVLNIFVEKSHWHKFNVKLPRTVYGTTSTAILARREKCRAIPTSDRDIFRFVALALHVPIGMCAVCGSCLHCLRQPILTE